MTSEVDFRGTHHPPWLTLGVLMSVASERSPRNRETPAPSPKSQKEPHLHDSCLRAELRSSSATVSRGVVCLPPTVLLGVKGDQKPVEGRERRAGGDHSEQGLPYIELVTLAT